MYVQTTNKGAKFKDSFCSNFLLKAVILRCLNVMQIKMDDIFKSRFLKPENNYERKEAHGEQRLTISTKILKSDNAEAIAVTPYTTACSPNKMTFPGADEVDEIMTSKGQQTAEG